MLAFTDTQRTQTIQLILRTNLKHQHAEKGNVKNDLTNKFYVVPAYHTGKKFNLLEGE
jgi:hypothetical protein